MSDHLPECPATDCGCERGEECGPRCIHTCICRELRACEARAREEMTRDLDRWVPIPAREAVERARAEGFTEGQNDKYDHAGRVRFEGYKLGYAEALDRARDAVAEALGQHSPGGTIALAAIDALRGE